MRASRHWTILSPPLTMLNFQNSEKQAEEKHGVGADGKSTRATKREERGMEKIEKHLYRRQYATAGGDWSTKFYAVFTCWDSERRTFPAGDNLKDARDELGRLRTLDKGRYDF